MTWEITISCILHLALAS